MFTFWIIFLILIPIFVSFDTGIADGVKLEFYPYALTLIFFLTVVRSRLTRREDIESWQEWVDGVGKLLQDDLPAECAQATRYESR